MKDKHIKSNIFYNTLLIMILAIIYVFVFSDEGFIQINDKLELLEVKKEYLESLKQDIKQISVNIERLKSDKEYILSYAKTFGYIDKNNNEKIVRILRNETEESAALTPNTKEIKSNAQSNGRISMVSIIILISMIFFCLIFYIIIVTKKTDQKRYG